MIVIQYFCHVLKMNISSINKNIHSISFELFYFLWFGVFYPFVEDYVICVLLIVESRMVIYNCQLLYRLVSGEIFLIRNHTTFPLFSIILLAFLDFWISCWKELCYRESLKMLRSNFGEKKTSYDYQLMFLIFHNLMTEYKKTLHLVCGFFSYPNTWVNTRKAYFDTFSSWSIKLYWQTFYNLRKDLFLDP